MKSPWHLFLPLTAALTLIPHPAAAQESAAQRDARMQWWREARFGMFVHWETCMTMNGTWGYSAHDHNWKSDETLVRNLYLHVFEWPADGVLLLPVQNPVRRARLLATPHVMLAASPSPAGVRLQLPSNKPDSIATVIALDYEGEARSAPGKPAYDPNVLPQGQEYFELRSGLNNCRVKFAGQKTGRVAFLGGSITAMSGWRELVMSYSVDGSAFRSVDTFTRWSRSLHLPWAVMLDDSLTPGRHTFRVRIAAGHNAQGTGTAVRVFHLLLN